MSIYKDTKKTKDGRCYFFQVMLNGDLYKSKRYLTREEARKEEAKYILENKHPNRVSFVMVAEAYFDYLNTYCKYSTVYTFQKDYKRHIMPFFERYDINSINISIYNKWWLEMSKKGLKPKYLNKINSLLKNIFNYAIQNYGMEYNPVVKTFKETKAPIKTDKLHYITKDEFDTFIGVVDDPMYKLLFEFLFYTGARIGEVICLTWNDIDFNNKCVSITKTLYKVHKNTPTSNKTNQNRQIYLNDSLLSNLASYKASKEVYKDFSNSWYVFGDTMTLSTTSLQRKKHQYFVKSGVNEIRIHDFRHSHVSNMISLYLKSGHTDATKFFIMMSQRLGHTIPVMQKTYMHLFPDTQNDIVDMLNNL